MLAPACAAASPADAAATSDERERAGEQRREPLRAGRVPVRVVRHSRAGSVARRRKLVGEFAAAAVLVPELVGVVSRCSARVSVTRNGIPGRPPILIMKFPRPGGASLVAAR